jgi:hypothetical protein
MQNRSPSRVPFASFSADALAAVPAARSLGASLGLRADVVDSTLADVDRKLRTYADSEDIRSWVDGVLRFEVVQLGRLQFAREPDPAGRAIHIPELGPLTPSSVDEALVLARDMFGPGTYTCESWMLDPAVDDLPTTSNVRAFRARFTVPDQAPSVAPGVSGTPGDRAVAKFVFGRSYEDVLALPAGPMSSLRTLVHTRLVGGYHWSEPLGTLHLA